MQATGKKDAYCCLVKTDQKEKGKGDERDHADLRS
jgi:hypothetical protein